MGEILDRIDHQFLNEIPPFDVINPSAENIAEYFYQQMTGKTRGDTRPGAHSRSENLGDGNSVGHVPAVGV